MKRVVIVGFPNVGKSSLFNRLTSQRKSLVHSLPGMTRDAVSAPCRLGGLMFELVDTGGFFGSPDEPYSARVREKAWQEAQRADLVLLLLDGRRDLLPSEEELYSDLIKSGKRVLVAVNKIDTPALESRLGDFYRLGGERIIPLSAEHNRNLDALEDALVESLPPGASEEDSAPPLRVAVVGRINVGKSSLINRLCGEERLIVSQVPGTTRDSTDVLLLRHGKPFLLVDTAGLRKLSRTRDEREKAGILRSKKNISLADVVCLVMDAQECPTRQDTAVAHLARDSGKPLILAVNKWDLAAGSGDEAHRLKDRIVRKLEFVSYAPLVFVSAKTGTRVVKILDLAGQVYEEAGRRVETHRLNDFLARTFTAHPPLSRDGRRVKVKYMVQGGVRPPLFIIFGHSRTRLAPAYETHFLQLLRREFGFEGSPLRLIFRQG
ncbi:MAG: ribosome biogenesis GTPase Der [Candidatus Aminicenantes bacterium RBG_13_62_12]|nr:MAG: ribosome biogenesis GTPase Der [Candidatus Aminicenantes bacterium RBG_13_62_12]